MFVSGERLGAYDAAEYARYKSAVEHGQSWTPNSTLEDPNGGIIYFDENGGQDRYSPPPAFHPTTFGGTVSTDSFVEKDPFSTWYGWTEYEKGAFAAIQLPVGPWTAIVTDYLRTRAKGDGTYSDADKAESDRQLRAFAASSAKVQAALNKKSPKTAEGGGGAFTGEQTDKLAAEEAARIAGNAKRLLEGWLAYRASLPNGIYELPQMPPNSWLGPAASDRPTMDALRALVAALPPDPKRPTVPVTTTVTPPPPPPIVQTTTRPVLTVTRSDPAPPPAQPRDNGNSSTTTVVQVPASTGFQFDKRTLMIGGGIALGLGVLIVATTAGGNRARNR